MRTYFCFLLAITATIIPSCVPCEAIECDEIPPYGHFIIVNGTGHDLVFGPNRIYDYNRFKFYSLSATDTTFFEYQIVETGDARFENALRVLFSPIDDVAYMQLSDGDIDTLNIAYRTSESRCCGTSTIITNFRHNGSDEIPADTWIQPLIK